MRIASLARWHPFLLLGLFSYVLVVLPWIAGWDYDEHTLATVVFLVGQMVGIVFHLLNFTLVALHGGVVMPYQAPLVSVLGLSVYVAADIALSRWARRAGSGGDSL